jgi:CheY-like chemotaxis protein
MTPEVLARAFEPFFTTKAMGAGSGLGLSQVFGTARQSGGEVQIETALGQGTAVIVDLPRAKDPPVRRADPAERNRYRGSDVTILLVDDDDAVRAVTGSMLREIGYHIREAEDGEQALAMLRRHDDIAVLLTDLVMPNLDGRQLGRMARALDPDLVILLMTGSAERGSDQAASGAILIRKPFGPGDLYRAVEEGLAQRASADP